MNPAIKLDDDGDVQGLILTMYAPPMTDAERMDYLQRQVEYWADRCEHASKHAAVGWCTAVLFAGIAWVALLGWPI